MKRRDFLKRSALTLGAIAFTGKEAMAQKIREDHNMPGMIHDGIPSEDSLWYRFHKAKGMQPDVFASMFLPKKIKGWGFNGSIPGPTIEVFEGDKVRIIVKNEIPEPTSIHWHGIELPNEMDGVGGLTRSEEH